MVGNLAFSSARHVCRRPKGILSIRRVMKRNRGFVLRFDFIPNSCRKWSATRRLIFAMHVFARLQPQRD
jgi:hypothetical protein